MPKYKRSPTIHTTPFLKRTSRMPSPRRLKTLTLLLLITVVLVLFYRSSGSDGDQDVGDFYYKTKTALDQKAGPAGSYERTRADAEVKGDADEDLELTKQMSERLKQAAKVAKINTNAKAPKPDPPSSVIGVGSSAGGKGKGNGKDSESSIIPGVAGVRRKKDDQKVVTVETKEDHEVELELNLILKKAPVIIFSKTYCPHSQHAKDILLHKYIIDPPPYVVELDKHALGVNLQGRLADLTNRKTVPNVLVNGVSIGGGDDVAELDESGKLVEKIKEFGGKKIFEARLRAGSNREREKEKEAEREKEKEKAKARVRLVHGSDPPV